MTKKILYIFCIGLFLYIILFSVYLLIQVHTYYSALINEQNKHIESLRNQIKIINDSSANSVKYDLYTSLKADTAIPSSFNDRETMQPSFIRYSEAECESQYGMEIITKWRNKGKTWCKSSQSMHLESEIKCYPNHQYHNTNSRFIKYDTFCEAKNIFINFSKISPHSYSKGTASSEKQTYFNYDPGFLFSNCHKTNEFNKNLLMSQQKLIMQSFISNVDMNNFKEQFIEVNQSTYLPNRDQDFDNTFHSTADFVISK